MSRDSSTSEDAGEFEVPRENLNRNDITLTSQKNVLPKITEQDSDKLTRTADNQLSNLK